MQEVFSLEGLFIVSDLNEILTFPQKFLYQKVDYVKLTNIKTQTGKVQVQVRQILGYYQDDISRNTATKDAFISFLAPVLEEVRRPERVVEIEFSCTLPYSISKSTHPRDTL